MHCISARDVDCLSNTTWVRDAKGKILYDQDGKPRIDTSKLDPKQYIGRWTGLGSQSVEGKKNAFITQISKLPGMEAIPILKNQWVLTWTLGKEQDIAYKKPTVVLTYVGKDAPFNSTVEYGGVANSPKQASLPTKDEDPSHFTHYGCRDINPNDDFIRQCTARIEQEAARRTDFSRAFYYLEYKIYDQAITAFTQDIRLLEAASRTRRPEWGLDNVATLQALRRVRAWGLGSLYSGRAEAYQGIGQYDDALADYGRAITGFKAEHRGNRLKPGLADAYSGRAEAYQKKGQYNAALADYSRAIRVGPGDDFIGGYIDRGNVYFLKKDYNAAIADYTKAIEKLSAIDQWEDAAEVLVRRGNAHYMKFDYDPAITDYRRYAAQVEKLVGTQPKQNDYWKTATVAEVQLIKGNYEDAAKLYQSAVDMAPTRIDDHRSTWGQAKLLLQALRPSDAEVEGLKAAFAHLD